MYHKKRYERIDRMKTRLIETPFKGLVVVEIDYFQDDRGFLFESWNKEDFRKSGLNLTFFQEVHSKSKNKTLRGLHYQDATAPMEKLVRCIQGNIFFVAVDLRKKSSTFGKWYGIELTAENKKQLYIPIGFAVGFTVLTDSAEILYKFTKPYKRSADKAIFWNDANLDIKWPITDPILSNRDKEGISFEEYKRNPSFL